jgi:predicted esterase
VKLVARRSRFRVAPPLLAFMTVALPAAMSGDLFLFKDVDAGLDQSHLAPLEVQGYPDAVVVEPTTHDGPRPLVIVLHGLGDRPEPNCEAWRAITGDDAFVLCPRGYVDAERSYPGSPRYTLPRGPALIPELDAAVSALSARFGDAVDVGRPLLAGFSLGATEASFVAQQDPERFPHVALLDGGVDSWLKPAADGYAAGGGRRVVFGCGSPWCPARARQAAGRLESAGVGAHTVVTDVGHRNAPALEHALGDELAWLVEEDPRWREGPRAGP